MARGYTQVAPFCAACILALGATTAQAQDRDSSARKTQGDQVATGTSATVEDIVVTARRTKETVQTAPLAITAVNGEALEKDNITNLTQLQSHLPSVEFQVATSIPIITIRGVGTYNAQAGVDPAVAYTVDGIFLSHPQAYPPVLVDIARVESLRGPQGTLYGRNSNGGAINFLTNEPALDKFSASAAITYGAYNEFGSELVLNAPLTESTALRIAFASNKHDGYYPFNYSNGDNWVGRIRLLIQPSDRFKMVTTVDRYSSTNDGDGFDYCPPHTVNPLCAGHPFRPYTGLEARDPLDFNRLRTWGVYNQIDLNLGSVVLTALTSYRDNTFLSRQAQITTTVNQGFLQGVQSKTFSQEVRISSNEHSPVKWIVGAYYTHESGPGTEIFYANGFNYFYSDPILKAESKAVFGDVTVPLSSSVRLTGGLRYTDENKSAHGPMQFITDVTTNLTIDANFSTKRVTWKAGAEADVGPDSLVYANVSTGFKSGGVNQVPNVPGYQTSYEPETITAYQLGSKNRLLDRRMTLNAEVFYYDYRNFQALDVHVDPTGVIPGFFLQTANSQKASMYGGELEATVALSRDDRLSLTGTWLHARFDKFLLGGADLSGNQIQAAPDFTVQGSFEHTFHLAGGERLTAGVNSKWVAGHFVDNSNAPGSYQSPYTRTDANLTFESADGRWQVSAFVKNIENHGIIMSFEQFGGFDAALLYAPRTFGGTLRYQY